jgi:hypothetical protein
LSDSPRPSAGPAAPSIGSPPASAGPEARRVRGAGTALAVLSAALVVGPAGAQTPQRPLPQGTGIIIANTGSYESQYGQPVYYSLELLATLTGSADPMAPAGRSVVTRGVFVAQAGPRLCTPDGNHCVGLEPVPEMAGDFAFQKESHAGATMEVTGAFLGGSILMWRFVGAEPATQARDAKDIPLEWIVRDPRSYAGRTILARGSFRGRNLFAEMPEGTARTPQDWVLGDGPFFIWVTGRPPRGKGFTLDPASRADAVHRLEVEGRVEEVNGLVYLKAGGVRLIGRGGGPAPGAP